MYPKKHCDTCIYSYHATNRGPLRLLHKTRQHCRNPEYNSPKYTSEMFMEDRIHDYCRWQMYGHYHIQANSLKEAIKIALGPDTPLPDGLYVEDSVAVDYEVLELDQGKKNSVLTKQELRVQLQQGHTLSDLLAFGPGQDCEIFKANRFQPGDVVIYVPDVSLNHTPLDRPITDPEDLAEVLSNCYTGQDFINECSGDAEKAERLFYYCDWQHPSSAIDELADDGEES